MPHEQLLRPGWQAPGFLVSFCERARGTHEGKRKPTLLFSPPVCVRARPRNFALRPKKISLRSPGWGVLRISSVFQRVKLLKNNSFFSKFLNLFGRMTYSIPEPSYLHLSLHSIVERYMAVSAPWKFDCIFV